MPNTLNHEVSRKNINYCFAILPGVNAFFICRNASYQSNALQSGSSKHKIQAKSFAHSHQSHCLFICIAFVWRDILKKKRPSRRWAQPRALSEHALTYLQPLRNLAPSYGAHAQRSRRSRTLVEDLGACTRLTGTAQRTKANQMSHVRPGRDKSSHESTHSFSGHSVADRQSPLLKRHTRCG